MELPFVKANYKVEVLKNALTRASAKYYEKVWPEFKTTGDILKYEFPDGQGASLIVFKGKFTPSYGCRDCGDHYIIAWYTHYDRVDKATLEITPYVEDK